MTSDGTGGAANRLDAQIQRSRRRRQRAAGVGLLLATSVLWSVSGVAVKVVRIDPLLFAFWRSLAAGAVMAPLAAFSSGTWPPRQWILPSIVIYTAVVSLLITAMTLDTAAAGILLQYTGPVFCALLAWLLQGRRIGARTWLAIALATAGVLYMVAGGRRSGGIVGPTCGALSGLAFGGLILVLEKMERLAGGRTNPFAIVAINNLGCAGLLAPLVAVMTGSFGAAGWKIAVVCATGAVQLAVPYVLFQVGLRRVSGVDASLLILLEPVLNPVWVWLATGERPDLATLAGGAAILVAMVLDATKSPEAAEAGERAGTAGELT